jgi:hypothetical protein
VSDFTTFNADDIDAAFKRIKTLKHHQLLELELQGLRVRLVGYPSGHMIGGTVWTIETGGEVMVYAPATNHSKERWVYVVCVVAAEEPFFWLLDGVSGRSCPCDSSNNRPSLASLAPLLPFLCERVLGRGCCHGVAAGTCAADSWCQSPCAQPCWCVGLAARG